MAAVNKEDKKAAKNAIEVLLNVLPKSGRGIQDIAYLVGLICRETGVPVEQATDVIMSWSERLRALTNFKELFPAHRKLSFYRYRVRYSVQSAYKRVQAQPSPRTFFDLTGQEAPAASFWAKLPPAKTKSKPEKPAGGN
jgi:hypothetical protein